MVLFNRFKRKKSSTKAVPPEVKQYYASEHRERVGLAWLIAFLSLLVTVAVVAGLFFGGRWAYRKIAHKDNKSTSTGTTAENTSGSSSQNNPEPASKPSNLQPTTPPPPNDSGEVSVDSGDSGSSSSSSSGSSSSSSSSGSSNSTGSKSTDITNTGPGSTLTIFVAVTILATVAHWQYQRRRLATSN